MKEITFKTYCKVKKAEFNKTFSEAKLWEYPFAFIGFMTHIRYFKLKKAWRKVEEHERSKLWNAYFKPITGEEYLSSSMSSCVPKTYKEKKRINNYSQQTKPLLEDVKGMDMHPNNMHTSSPKELLKTADTKINKIKEFVIFVISEILAGIIIVVQIFSIVELGGTGNTFFYIIASLFTFLIFFLIWYGLYKKMLENKNENRNIFKLRNH
jgi:hypothetical protein